MGARGRPGGAGAPLDGSGSRAFEAIPTVVEERSTLVETIQTFGETVPTFGETGSTLVETSPTFGETVSTARETLSTFGDTVSPSGKMVFTPGRFKFFDADMASFYARSHPTVQAAVTMVLGDLNELLSFE